MRFHLTVICLAASVLALPSNLAVTSNLAIYEAPRIEARSEVSDHLEKRVAPQIARVVLRTWFKIGKSILKSYEKLAEEFDADGAGFHRDFSDLVEAELPEPPAGFDPNVVPT